VYSCVLLLIAEDLINLQDAGVYFKPRHSHILFMIQHTIQWRSTREPAKTKAELREMLAEAVRNTAQPQPKPPTKTKRDRPKKAA
jgi:hypothetical protein